MADPARLASSFTLWALEDRSCRFPLSAKDFAQEKAHYSFCLRHTFCFWTPRYRPFSKLFQLSQREVHPEALFSCQFFCVAQEFLTP